MINESAPLPASLNGVVGGVPGGVPGGVLNGVIGSVVNSASTPQLPKLVAQPQRIRISQGVSEGLLIHKVKPLYPEIAREARVQGPVVPVGRHRKRRHRATPAAGQWQSDAGGLGN